MSFTGKILLVDDEAHIRKYVTLVLKSICGATILEAGDGEQALATFAREKPDLVLLDINMPRMDGLQALQRLRESDPDVNVVMLTSLTNRRSVEECERFGALGYIRKDMGRDDLTRELDEIIRDCVAPPPPAPASTTLPT